jgi:hypothetical protein
MDWLTGSIRDAIDLKGQCHKIFWYRIFPSKTFAWFSKDMPRNNFNFLNVRWVIWYVIMILCRCQRCIPGGNDTGETGITGVDVNGTNIPHGPATAQQVSKILLALSILIKHDSPVSSTLVMHAKLGSFKPVRQLYKFPWIFKKNRSCF